MPPRLVTSATPLPKVVRAKRTKYSCAWEEMSAGFYNYGSATNILTTASSSAVTYNWITTSGTTEAGTLSITADWWGGASGADWWGDASGEIVVQQPLLVQAEPAEARDARRRAHAVAQAVVEAGRQEANGRARRLLLAHLNPQQRITFEKNGYFDILKGDRFYRVCYGRSANVVVYLRRGLDWYPDHVLCCHPRDLLPDEDTMLTQKFMIEVEEQQFVKTANKHPIDGAWGRHYLGQMAEERERLDPVAA